MNKSESSIKHPWDVTPKEAIAIQQSLRGHVRLVDDFSQPATVAGVDVGFEQDGEVTRAAVAVLDFPSLVFRESAIARLPTTFPYVPGLLSFREIPAVLKAMEQLSALPDMVLCDGQGYAHPRRLGIACHLGLLLDIPSIGVGKSRLVGTYGPVPEQRGGWTPLEDKGEIVGAVLRTRVGIKPLFVSPGHRIGLESAVAFVMACTGRYKLPETTRWAHKLASGY